ncbi:hypothetical protein [Bradyrhizobium canariense]|uniref:hypothetical protein n=1 Tax=Bradyrhizobium canariense TaxID=255045 RepID=UPI001B8A259E|nr:hypothetical protein [Bradyrhizobium canariense]MBR0949002.1 hypothetical protein [Bradyrhizobium canariense]
MTERLGDGKAWGARNNPTIGCCELTFTMTPQNVAAVQQLSPGTVQKTRDAPSDRKYLVRHLDMKGQKTLTSSPAIHEEE